MSGEPFEKIVKSRNEKCHDCSQDHHESELNSHEEPDPVVEVISPSKKTKKLFLGQLVCISKLTDLRVSSLQRVAELLNC